MQLSVDPGMEWAVPEARRELARLKASMADNRLGPYGVRTINLGGGEWIWIRVTEFVDRIVIRGGGGYFWEEGYPEQDLWNTPSAVLPEFKPGSHTLPIQHITYEYLTNDTNIHETLHQWVICRYCRRIAEFSLTESWVYGTNIEITNCTYVSNTDNVVTVALLSPNAGQQRRIFGTYVPGSGKPDPGFPSRTIPLMIKKSDNPVSVSTVLVDGESDGDGGFIKGLDFFRLVSRDDVSGTAVIMPPTMGSVGSVFPVFKQSIVHLGEVVSQDETNITMYDYADNGVRASRLVPHGLRALEVASTWGLLDADPAPDASKYTTSFTGYGPAGRAAQWGSPGPALFQGVTWSAPGGRGGSVSTPVFYLIIAGQWGSITGALSIYGSGPTTDYYQGGEIDSSFFDPYSYSGAPAAYATDTVAWRARQLAKAKVLWDFVQSEMDKKRFCPTAETAELRPHPTKQFDKLLVFPVRSTAVLNIVQSGNVALSETYTWHSSYFPWGGLTYNGVSLENQTDLGPIPKWSYSVDQPCLYTWSKRELTAAEKITPPAEGKLWSFKLSATPPEYQRFYFSFGTTDFSGYNQRPYFGFYHVKGTTPETGLYAPYDQAMNDEQMKNVCVLTQSLGWAAYSNLFKPLRGAYWRKTNHTHVSTPYSVTQPAIPNVDKDPLIPV